MSYSCTIKTGIPIKEKDIDSIVEDLPEKLSQPLFGNTKQDWGWSCGCDIYKPKGNKVTIGGSYSVSGNISKEFVEYFTNRLWIYGYNILNIDWSF